MSYPWKLDIVAALPCRVKGKPGSSIKTFFFSKPRARSAKPRPLLKPQVTMLWEGAHWIPPASARYAAISCRNSSSPRGFGYTGGALISARTARVRILANGMAGKVSCAGGPIWKTAGCAVSSWYISINEPALWASSCRTATEGRFATCIPVPPEATISRAEGRATPVWAAKSCQEGGRAAGASTRLSMAALTYSQICSASGVFAGSIKLQLERLRHVPWYTIFVHSWCFFADQARSIYRCKGEHRA
jgi:hypothetical protein